MGFDNPLDCWTITIEGRGTEENAMFYLPKTTFDQLNVPWKISKMLVLSTGWEQLNS